MNGTECQIVNGVTVCTKVISTTCEVSYWSLGSYGINAISIFIAFLWILLYLCNKFGVREKIVTLYNDRKDKNKFLADLQEIAKTVPLDVIRNAPEIIDVVRGTVQSIQQGKMPQVDIENPAILKDSVNVEVELERMKQDQEQRKKAVLDVLGPKSM